MTRPSDIKPREGEQPGTFAENFSEGTELPQLCFTITPEIVSEYIASIDVDPAGYKIEDRFASPPNVLAVYLLAILYRRFPPAQGIILAKQTWEFYSPIWADEETEVIAGGSILTCEARRNKQFLRWKAQFSRADGTKIATAENELYVPTQEESTTNA